MNLLAELPFFAENSKVVLSPFELRELFRDGYTNSKSASDGILKFHSVTFATSNAKEMARYFEAVLGFREVAIRNLETSSSLVGSHVVTNGNATLVFANNLETPDGRNCTPDIHQEIKAHLDVLNSTELACVAGQFASVRKLATKKKLSAKLVEDAIDAWHFHRFASRHGMGVCDVTLQVTSVEETFNRAVKNGATALKKPAVEQDVNGSVKVAIIGVPDNDIRHTLIEYEDYAGPFLPHYGKSERAATHLGAKVQLHEIDHCVQNFSWEEMMPNAQFYALIFGLHKFWSVDDKDVSTGNTALRSIVMASANGKVKMPINEPAKARLRGQIEEFHDYFGGPGVQHLALLTREILSTVEALRSRGLKFNLIQPSYYVELERRLARDGIELKEDFNKIREFQILVDYDPATKFKKLNGKFGCNYILQIFSEPFHDRPTCFIEIIQRHHHNGFGKGTFKGLFELIELEQRKRGTLVPLE